MRSRFPTAALWALTLLATALPALAQEIKNTSYVATDGMRVLRHEIIVDATREEVWKAFTTSEGWISWATPVAFVDFRLGGTIETSYDPDAKLGNPSNIRHQIMSYLPGEMLSMRVIQTPPNFPHRELMAGLWAVFTFEDAGEGRTKVTSAGAGYREGEGYDTIYGFFETGNAMSLRQLHRMLREGPVDWSEALGVVTRHQEAEASSGGGD